MKKENLKEIFLCRDSYGDRFESELLLLEEFIVLYIK